MAPRPSFEGQFVTKPVSYGSSYTNGYAGFNPRWHGIVIREFTTQSKVSPNRSNLYAEVMLFPSGKIENIFKSRLHLVSDSDFKSKIESHSQYSVFQTKLKQHLKAHE